VTILRGFQILHGCSLRPVSRPAAVALPIVAPMLPEVAHGKPDELSRNGVRARCVQQLTECGPNLLPAAPPSIATLG
jgi:hypothetical protein